MSRRSTLAAVTVATGVLIAASVASVAAISASASSREQPTTGSQAVVVSLPASTTTPVSALPEVGSDDELTVPTVGLPGTAPQAGATAPSTSGDAGASRDGRRGGTRPSGASGIRSTQAKAAVVRVSPGRVLDVSRAQRSGYASYSVTVERADGSVVTGYVDRASGVVFDWVKVSGPTVSSAGTTSSGPTSHGDDDARESSDDYEDNESEDESADHDSDNHESYGESDDDSHESDD